MSDAWVAIVYHSGYGHTVAMAAAVERGAAAAHAATHLISIDDEIPWHLLDDHLWCTDIHGRAVRTVQSVQDATSRTVFAAGNRWRDKLAADFTNSASRSGDKLATLQQLAIFAAQHGMHWISLGLPPGNNSLAGSESDINRLGFFLGATAQSNADEGPNVAPPQSDLLAAEHLGKRVAEAALQFARGRAVQAIAA